MKTIKIQMTDVWPRTDGKEPKNNSPVLDYCRKLIKDGEDKKTRLEVYRGEVLCLIVKEIGKGAKLAILENENEGPKLIKYKPLPDKYLKQVIKSGG